MSLVLPGRQAARGKLLPQISACLRAMRTALKLISVCVRARARVRVCVATCLGVVVVTDCVCASVCARQHGVWSHVVTRHARVCLRGVFH